MSCLCALKVAQHITHSMYSTHCLGNSDSGKINDEDISRKEKGGYSQQTCTHGTLVSMHFAVWATDRVILPGANEHSIPHLVLEFTAEFLENEEIFSQSSFLPFLHLCLSGGINDE